LDYPRAQADSWSFDRRRHSSLDLVGGTADSKSAARLQVPFVLGTY
jgi:hypothetical protein